MEDTQYLPPASSRMGQQMEIRKTNGLYAERLKTNSDIFTPLRDPTAQIRLLRLDLSSTREHIIATLHTWNKSSLPAFNAISYVCGQALPLYPVRINGGAFHIGNNCLYALSQVCLHYPGTYVWIDAICINQQNLAEKSAQVSIMGGIYRLSSRVLACIGPSDAASDEIVRVTEDVDSFVQAVRPDWLGPPARREPLLWTPPFWDPPMDESSTLKLWDIFTEFERRPYFSRAWIVQELSAGVGRTTVLCGLSRIDWKALSTLAERLSRLYTMYAVWDAPYKLNGRNGTGHVIDTLRTLGTTFQSSTFPFPHYLRRMIYKNCQDPRDRFFGTLDLVDWKRFGQTRPVSDYHRTPLELSLNLLQRLVNPTLEDALLISESLGLQFSPQVLSDIERAHLSRDRRYDIRRWYSFSLQAVHEIEQGADGRLVVDLDHKDPPQYVDSVPHYFDGREYESTFLAAHGLAPLFTDDKASVLASACVRAGDLLVHTGDGCYLLRRHGNPPRLLVVGTALLAVSYTFREKYGEPPAGCICWKSALKTPDDHSVIWLQLELPDTVALGSAIAHPGKFNSYDRDRIFSYLNRYGVGTVMAHSGLGSPLTAHMRRDTNALRSQQPGHSSRKHCANCKKTGNPFWYLLEPDEEGVVSFGK